MSQDEAEAVQPNLIDLYTAREGDTWQSIAQRAGKGLVSASTLAIMNDHAIDEQPKPGTRLKIVVAGSYDADLVVTSQNCRETPARVRSRMGIGDW